MSLFRDWPPTLLFSRDLRRPPVTTCHAPGQCACRSRSYQQVQSTTEPSCADSHTYQNDPFSNPLQDSAASIAHRLVRECAGASVCAMTLHWPRWRT